MKRNTFKSFKRFGTEHIFEFSINHTLNYPIFKWLNYLPVPTPTFHIETLCLQTFTFLYDVPIFLFECLCVSLMFHLFYSFYITRLIINVWSLDRIVTPRRIQPHRSKHSLQKATNQQPATPRDHISDESRDRRDSDPGTLRGDPEVTVDKGEFIYAPYYSTRLGFTFEPRTQFCDRYMLCFTFLSLRLGCIYVSFALLCYLFFSCSTCKMHDQICILVEMFWKI